MDADWENAPFDSELFDRMVWEINDQKRKEQKTVELMKKNAEIEQKLFDEKMKLRKELKDQLIVSFIHKIDLMPTIFLVPIQNEY